MDGLHLVHGWQRRTAGTVHRDELGLSGTVAMGRREGAGVFLREKETQGQEKRSVESMSVLYRYNSYHKVIIF